MLLGKGVLEWASGERVSDRYGTVKLFTDTGEEKTIPLNDKVSEGVVGQLIAVVEETRESPHIGDFVRGIYPSQPKVGEEFTLGTGKLFFEEDNAVGLQPLESRQSDWLDPHILYKLHFQTVSLYFAIAT
jgi:hypothetical protein